jgi:hemolysin activation/secretion protein
MTRANRTEAALSSRRSRLRAVVRLGVLALVACPKLAIAQTATLPLPPPTDLARPQAPLTQPKVMVPQRNAAPVVMPENAATTQVDVVAITLDGVTAYPDGALASLYGNLIGQRVALSEVFAAAARIEARYRADGFPLARVIIPAQDVPDGRYHIRIVEGFVSEIVIDGNPGAVRGLIQKLLAPVMRSKPARMADIERALLLANDLPGYQVTSTLTPDAATPGAAKLIVSVQQKRVDVFATLNNRGSRAAGPLTGTIGTSLNNLGSFGGHVGALYYTTFNGEQNFAELSVDGRVGSKGLKLRGWASYGTSSPGSILAPLDIKSRSLLAGIGFEYPIVRSRALNISAHGSLEFSRDRTRILGTPISEDRQRALRLGFDVSGRDHWNGFTSIGVTLHKGLDIMNASHDGEAIPQSRLGGRSDFFKLTATASRVQQLWTGQSSSLTLVASASAQFAGDDLLSLEQFHVGGEQFGRGFNPAQISGDNGFGGALELQFTNYTAIGPINGQQFYAFIDGAKVRDRGTVNWQRYQSAGGGVRFDLGKNLSGQFEVAVPYKGGRQIDAKSDTGAQAFFRITARY